jgi:hypothetical protein
VFNTYYLSDMHNVKVTPIFVIVDYDGISISTARGRLTPEVMSLVDRATTVFYSCFVDIYRLSCTVSTLFALLLLPKMVDRRFRPLGGRARPEVKLPLDFLIPIWWYRSVLEFFDYLLPVQSYSTFSICM